MTIEERLEAVERELAETKIGWAISRRRIKRLWICLGLVVAAFALIWGFTATTGSARAQGAGKVIRANEIIVEDENGMPRVKLTALKSGSELALYDGNGKLRAMLSADKDGSALALSDVNGLARATLTALKGDESGLWLFDKRGKARAELSTLKDGPRLMLQDENGVARAMLGKGETEKPDGATTTFPESSIRLFGPDSKVLWMAP